MEHLESTRGEEPRYNHDIQDREGLNRLYEESIDRIREGEIIRGEVVDFTNDAAVIDIGYKSEGYVSLSELAESEEGRELHMGDEVEVLLLQREDEDGHPILSISKAEDLKIQRYIEDVYQKGGTLKGKIISKVKGGFRVDVGLQAFLPTSQVGFKSIQDRDQWIGTEHEFKILSFDRRTRNVVVSRRKNLEQEVREKVLGQLSVGQICEGAVSSVAEFGLFVDLGVIKGLVHKSNISWGKVDHPADSYGIGERVRVKILDIDEESLRIALGIKQLEPNPWEHIAEKYPIGTIIEGTISDIKDFGLFVAIDEEIEGLIHQSNMTWTKPLYHPGEIFHKGQIIRAMVLEIDPENEHFTLGIKQLTPDPWDHIPQRYRPGTLVRGKVFLISERGLIVQLEEGVESILPVSRLPKNFNLSEFQEGEAILIKVVSASPRSKKIESTLPKPGEISAAEKTITFDKDLARRLKEAMTGMTNGK